MLSVAIIPSPKQLLSTLIQLSQIKRQMRFVRVVLLLFHQRTRHHPPLCQVGQPIRGYLFQMQILVEKLLQVVQILRVL